MSLCGLLLVGWLHCVVVQSVDAGRVGRCMKLMLEADRATSGIVKMRTRSLMS